METEPFLVGAGEDNHTDRSVFMVWALIPEVKCVVCWTVADHAVRGEDLYLLHQKN